MLCLHCAVFGHACCAVFTVLFQFFLAHAVYLLSSTIFFGARALCCLCPSPPSTFLFPSPLFLRLSRPRRAGRVRDVAPLHPRQARRDLAHPPQLALQDRHHHLHWRGDGRRTPRRGVMRVFHGSIVMPLAGAEGAIATLSSRERLSIDLRRGGDGAHCAIGGRPVAGRPRWPIPSPPSPPPKCEETARGVVRPR